MEIQSVSVLGEDILKKTATSTQNHRDRGDADKKESKAEFLNAMDPSPVQKEVFD